MKRYGKIVCGALRVPLTYPGYIIFSGHKVYNPTVSQLKSEGYLPIEETEPVEKEGFTAVASYEVSGRKIIQSWNYVETPEQSIPEDETEPKTTKKSSK